MQVIARHDRIFANPLYEINSHICQATAAALLLIQPERDRHDGEHGFRPAVFE
ncbi:MAG: hypothetical protein H7234_06785, partial [Herminiimonas sp.]|nr:hypothetical protein [Herminiimonas sp.]